MLVPLSWLKRYVPVDLPAGELAHRLTMAGLEIGAVEETGADWDRDKVLVGHVLEVNRHPNADRLSLPTVDLGNGETATVVCGAPNVAAGQKIAFAREGAMLRSNRTGKVEPLKSAKIRGVLSSGMVCSERELGLGEDHDGILVLGDDLAVGTPLVDVLGDAILDAEVTPNRPDCLSILGVAREVGAITAAQVAEPDDAFAEDGSPIADRVTVEIEDPELCPRYTAGLVEGVRVGPSPEWLQSALAKAGQRTINNIVDITNFVMLEYGQPMHAFDFDKVAEGSIIVRQARRGERLATLDDETHDLRPPMLAIADPSGPVALAGVVGGVDSSVTEATTSVLLESANFDPSNTHRTKRALGNGTEASYRFERGIRADLAPRALRRATALILEVAGGTAAAGIVDAYPGRSEANELRVTGTRLRKVLGVDLPAGKVQGVLESLGFQVRDGEGDELVVMAPYWRSDIRIEDDVIEEVARIVGYDDIPTTAMATPIPHHSPKPFEDLRERVRDALAAAGMQEVLTYSLTDRETLDKVHGLDDIGDPLELANPMSRELQVLRTSLRGNMLKTLRSNRRMSRSEGLRLFEIGRVFIPKEEAKERDLPDERQMVVGAMSGPRFHASWLAQQADMDFFDAKGALEAMLAETGIEAVFEPGGDATMHPGKTARLLVEGTQVGVVGEVHPSALQGFDLEDETVAMFEIDLQALFEAASAGPAVYTPVSRFPQAERDVALIVDEGASSASIQQIIDRHKLVAASRPFDTYTGEGVPDGKKSVAYRIAFQSERATLTSEAIDRAQGDILRQLQRQLGAELRT
jgi:phenylalanyl-tRNA synthetase beta chain